MAATISCPGCGQRITTNAVPGTPLDCPRCGRNFEVPLLGADGRPVEVARRPSEAEPRRFRWAVLSAPWAISIILHVVALLFMTTFAIYKTIGFEEDDFIPDAFLGDKPGGAESAQQTAKQLTAVSQTKIRKHTPTQIDPLEAIDTDVDDMLIVGVGASSVPLASANLTGSSFFGVPSTGGRGGGNAMRIVYVVDRSGSMAETFDFVKDELKKAIRSLKSKQDFHVIFFSTGKPLENPPKKLVPATLENKRKFYKFLATVVAERGTIPGPAMKRAFAVTNDQGRGAQLIYFLTDGEFDRSLLRDLARWNRKRKVKINTFSFLYDAGAPLLKQIARDHGGYYKFISRYELGLQSK